MSPAPPPANSVALIVAPVKFPFTSRRTSVPGVLAATAAFARIAALARFAALTPPTFATTVAPCVPVTSPSKAPLKSTASSALKAVVAVAAFPSRFALIVPAEKSPLKFRRTIAPGVFALLALLPSVMLPVLPEIVIPPPPESDVTPAFESSTVPPSATVPPPARPAPAFTVIVEFASFALSTAPGAIFSAVIAPSATVCAVPAMMA